MSKKVRDLTAADVIIAEETLLNFQEAVILAMNEKNITQSELADQLGISRGRMSQILSSDANPTLKLVGRITAALDLVPRYDRKIATERPLMKFLPELDISKLVINNEVLANDRFHSGSWAVSSIRVPGQQWHNNDNQSTRANRKRLAA